MENLFSVISLGLSIENELAPTMSAANTQTECTDNGCTNNGCTHNGCSATIKKDAQVA